MLIRKNYLIKILQGWIRFMSEYNFYEVIAIMFFAAVSGFGFGIAIASYFNYRSLKKLQIELDKMLKEIQKDE